MTQNTESAYGTPGTAGAGKVAVVSGASTGIGEATVRRLRASGWTVYAVARREERLAELAEQTGAIAAPTDVTDQNQVDALRDRVLTEQGTVDAVLNSSGGARGTDSVADADPEGWQWMYDVNVLGTLRVTRAFLPALRANGRGTVLNLTSLAAIRAYEGGAGYNAAKYAERAMTEALRLEEAEHNVRVVEIAPGLVHTPEFSLNRLGGDLRVRGGAAAPREHRHADPQARGPGGTAQGDPHHLLRLGAARGRGNGAVGRTAHLRPPERVN